ncbi:MAG: 2-oxoglutarate and iron-dependent oxygenase domain-containing protein, partial [Rhodospirillales bacterium]
MAYATATEIDIADIPVINIAGLRSGDAGAEHAVAAQMLSAAGHLGFFYVSGHGVPQPLIDRADREARAFFAEPLEQKLETAINHRHRGFLRVGEAKMEGNRLPDLKESFVWGRETPADDPVAMDPGNPFIGPNNWPEGRPEMAVAFNDFYSACNAVGFDLMRAFAVAMELPEITFRQAIDYPISRGAAVYYPPQPANLDSDQFGVGPHTDYGCLTLVYQDPIGGLEVRSKQ